jgi:hypothetical protein
MVRRSSENTVKSAEEIIYAYHFRGPDNGPLRSPAVRVAAPGPVQLGIRSGWSAGAEVGQGEQVGAGAQVAGEEAGEGFWLEVDGCQRWGGQEDGLEEVVAGGSMNSGPVRSPGLADQVCARAR